VTKLTEYVTEFTYYVTKFGYSVTESIISSSFVKIEKVKEFGAMWQS